MGCFQILNSAKKIISIILLIIIFATTITSAISDTDINTIYNQIITGNDCKAFMTTLYATGTNLTNEPLSNDEINTRMKKYVTFVLNTSQAGVDDGTIDKNNYSSKIFAICMQKLIDAGLSELFQAAYPELIVLVLMDDVSISDVPQEMKPMFLLLANEVIYMLGIRPTPTPLPTPHPSIMPSPIPSTAPITSTAPTATPSPMVTPKPSQGVTTIRIGDYLQMGTYYNKPILWRCVDIDENGPLMLSDKILTIKPFDAAGNHKYLDGTSQEDYSGNRTYYGSNLWETSNIRSWLNSTATAGNVTWLDDCPPTIDNVYSGLNAYAGEKGFMADGNFSQGERYVIKSVTQKSLLNSVDAPKLKVGGTSEHISEFSISTVLQNYDTAYYENVTDKMFLLDVKQVNKVYQNGYALGTSYYIGQPTQKAVDNSEYKSSDLSSSNNFFYWLRSPSGNGDTPQSVRYVSSYASILGGSDGARGNANCYLNGIRPAFYLNLSSATYKSGTNGSIEMPYVLDFQATPIDVSNAVISGNVSSGLTANVSVNINNFSSNILQGKLAISLYDITNNKLKQIKITDILLNSNDLMTITETFDISPYQYKIKAFCWEGFNSIMPHGRSSEKIISPSDNALLNSIKTDGIDLFDVSSATNYIVPVKGNTFPNVTATAQDSNAIVSITQATAENNNAVITVTAQNGTIKTYSIHFVPNAVLLESEHPYSDNMNQTYTYTLSEALSSMQVTFSNLTEVENGYDYIYIMDGANNIIGNRYTGTELANQTIIVTGNTIKVRLTSDSSETKYGFDITRVLGVN